MKWHVLLIDARVSKVVELFGTSAVNIKIPVANTERKKNIQRNVQVVFQQYSICDAEKIRKSKNLIKLTAQAG